MTEETEKTLEEFQKDHDEYDTHDLEHWIYWVPEWFKYLPQGQSRELPEVKREYLKFRKEDEEKVRPTLKELAVRKDLEKYNPFLTGQEKAINESKIDDLYRRIRKFEVKS